jgi:DNA-directed RNA polymerase specialized sigma24 family protein
MKAKPNRAPEGCTRAWDTMAGLDRALEGLTRTERALLQRLMFLEAWDIVCKALARFRLDRATREDLAAESLGKAWANLGQYDKSVGTFKTWLSTIAAGVGRALHRPDAGSGLPDPSSPR